jgi:hypothetical protein
VGLFRETFSLSKKEKENATSFRKPPKKIKHKHLIKMKQKINKIIMMLMS